MEDIALAYGCNLHDVRRWNSLSGSDISQFSQLKLYIPQNSNPVFIDRNAPMPSALAAYLQPTQNTMVQATKMIIAPAVPQSTAVRKTTKLLLHEVKTGETLWEISRIYENIPVKQIIDNNDLKSSLSILPGTFLIIKT